MLCGDSALRLYVTLRFRPIIVLHLSHRIPRVSIDLATYSRVYLAYDIPTRVPYTTRQSAPAHGTRLRLHDGTTFSRLSTTHPQTQQHTKHDEIACTKDAHTHSMLLFPSSLPGTTSYGDNQ